MNRNRNYRIAGIVTALAMAMPGCEAAFALPQRDPIVAIRCELDAADGVTATAGEAPQVAPASKLDYRMLIDSRLNSPQGLLNPQLHCSIVERPEGRANRWPAPGRRAGGDGTGQDVVSM